jgi:hypothetical protein
MGADWVSSLIKAKATAPPTAAEGAAEAARDATEQEVKLQSVIIA